MKLQCFVQHVIQAAADFLGSLDLDFRSVLDERPRASRRHGISDPECSPGYRWPILSDIPQGMPQEAT